MKDIYQWLIDLREQVKTEGFFVFEPVGQERLRELSSMESCCSDYVEFITRFGAAKLCLQPDNIYYEVHVFPPKLVNHDLKEAMELAFSSDFKSLFYVPDDGKLWEGDGRPRQRSKLQFNRWLKQKMDRARRRMGEHLWEDIVRGPAPFTEDELRIVGAREQFQFEKIGVTPDGKVKVLVADNSSTTLHAFSVGVLVPEKLEGRVSLSVEGLLPGKSTVVERFIYKDFVDGKDIQLNRLPPPKPQDRKRYSEFQKIK